MNRFVHQVLVTALIVVALFSSLQAYAARSAAQAVSPAASAGLDPKVLAWWSITALVCSLAMNLTAPGTPTPWNWNPQARFYLALGATTLSGIAHSIVGGATYQTAILTAVTALVTALLTHFSTPGAMAKAGAATVLLLGLGFGSSGCAALFPGLTTGNPVADMTAAVQVTQTVDEGVEAVWAVAEPLLPASVQAQAQTDYADAQAGVATAIQVTEDAIAAYQAGDGSPPNWSALLTSLENAVDAVVTLAEKYGAQMGSAKLRLMLPQVATTVARIQAGQATLHKFRAP